jgi:hypothetical protein
MPAQAGIHRSVALRRSKHSGFPLSRNDGIRKPVAVKYVDKLHTRLGKRNVSAVRQERLAWRNARRPGFFQTPQTQVLIPRHGLLDAVQEGERSLNCRGLPVSDNFLTLRFLLEPHLWWLFFWCRFWCHFAPSLGATWCQLAQVQSREGKLWKPTSDGLLTLPCNLVHYLSRRLPCALGNRCSILLSYRPTRT